jgi:hypothetical protein
MGHDWSISDAANGTSVVGETTPGHRVCYVEPAPTIDVMFDQLEYLLAHKSRGCPPGCGSCKRLKQVESWLLLPFRTNGQRERFRRTTAAPSTTDKRQLGR